MKLYSYVVDHDTGFAPNPFGGLCTLACCKFSKTGFRRNIVELAGKGDWIVGTGGSSKRSSGHGTIIYAMQVTDTISFADYCRSLKFCKREDAKKASPNEIWRQVLISKHFFYFGCKAAHIPKRFSKIEKRGPGFKKYFSEIFIQRFVAWMKTHKRGKSGRPCTQKKEKGSAKTNTPRCGC